MKTAFGVELVRAVRKSENPKDVAEYQIWIKESRYFSKDSDRASDGRYPRTIRSARPMTEQCAKQLVEKLKQERAAQEINVIELVTDDEQYLPSSLKDLESQADESFAVTVLKSAVEQSLKLGMKHAEVSAICDAEIRGAARLRIAIEKCVAEKLSDDEIRRALNQVCS